MPLNFSSGAIGVSIDPAQLRAVEDVLKGIKNGAPRAISGAINDTVKFGLTQINRSIRDEINLSRKSVAERLKQKRATYSDLSGSITITRKPVSLSEFKPRPTPKGVMVSVRKGRRQLLRSTFMIAKAPGAVFERELTAGPGSKRAGRTPIVKRYGPTVLGVFEGLPGLAERTLAGLGERLSIRLASKVDYLLSQKNPDNG